MTIIDIPPGWAGFLGGLAVATLGVIGLLVQQRAGRLARLERENRELWLAVRLAVDTIYKSGITPPDRLIDLISTKETS
ncbi:MAG: hypothetical protein J0H96_01320 [Microbacterium ginsengisoli]|nr:hypothetical protein [Microbacterium ginsengisoli]